MEPGRILLSVAAIWGIAVITPGPNFFVTVQTALCQSRSTALLVVSGVCCGTLVWGLCGFFGLSLLFAAAPWLYFSFKLAGAAYLILLGLRLIVSSFNARQRLDLPIMRSAAPFAAWRLGLLTNLSNPKAAVFVTGLFAAAMPADAPWWLGFLSVAVMVVLSSLWYATVACLLSRPSFTALYRRCQRWIDRCAGVIFIGFGAKLASHR